MKSSVSRLALTAPIALLGAPVWAETASPWDLLASVDVTEIVTDTSYEVRKAFPESIKMA